MNENKPRRKIPQWLYDEKGNAYEMIMEKHRGGFNLVTFRQSYEEYEEV